MNVTKPDTAKLRSEQELHEIPLTEWSDDELDEVLRFCEEDSHLRTRIRKEQYDRGLR